MTNMLSLLKIFKKKKKKNETKPKVVPKSSLCITKPKQKVVSRLTNRSNSRFGSKSPQIFSEKDFDPKTCIQSARKTSMKTIDERRIELVGNYLKIEDTKQRAEEPPLRPQRKHSNNCKKTMENIETLKDCHKHKDTNPRDNRRPLQLIVNRNQINSSLDSIIEMNGNRVLKEEEKLQKTMNGLKTNEMKSQELATNSSNELHSTELFSKSNIDFIDSEFKGLNVSQNSLHFRSDKSENKSKRISGLVSVRDIDLKTDKCLICLGLVSKNINLTVCSHIFCADCMRQWLRYSQHCPQCRTFISSFGHSIRTQFNRICIRSEKDYKVKRITRNADNFVDSLGAAYLFEAFLSNREISKYLDSNIAKICAKISDLESQLSTKGTVQRNVNIRYTITEENHKLEEFKHKKRQSEEGFKEICGETNPQMLSFWKKVSVLRGNPVSI